MGDLKKKRANGMAKINHVNGFPTNNGEMPTDSQAIELLRGYIKQFYEMQMGNKESRERGKE